jgi:hypothetical protein
MTSSFLRLPGAGVIDQNLTHQARRYPIEV